MSKQLFWLSEEEWGRIEPYLPRGRRGAHRVDDRRVIFRDHPHVEDRGALAGLPGGLRPLYDGL
jgi:transposase